eukprot:jgi/Mesvir1/16515/Mv10065-RA.1
MPGRHDKAVKQPGKEQGVAMESQDPFDLVRQEIEDSITKIDSKFEHWKLKSHGPEKTALAGELDKDCGSVGWQVEELEKAIAVAESNMVKFHVTAEEISSRRRWTGSTRIKLATMRRTVASATAALNAAAAAGSSSSHSITGSSIEMKLRAKMEANEKFLASEREAQQSLLKQQDQDLDELSESVARLGGVGLTIHDELKSQEGLLEEFHADLDGASNRLEMVQRRMQAILRQGGTRLQIALVVILLILLAVLIGLTFS